MHSRMSERISVCVCVYVKLAKDTDFQTILKIMIKKWFSEEDAENVFFFFRFVFENTHRVNTRSEKTIINLKER